MLTKSWFGNNAFRGVARLSRPGSVHCDYSELVFVAFLDTIGDLGGGAISENFGHVYPLAAFLVPHLHDVLLDRGAPVVFGRSPLEIDEVFVPVSDFRPARFSRLVERVLRNDGFVRFQIVRFALPIYRLHAEFVRFPFLKTRHRHFRFHGFRARDPLPRQRIQLFDLVVLDRHTTVVVRFLPFQLATVFVHVGYFQRALRFEILSQ